MRAKRKSSPRQDKNDWSTVSPQFNSAYKNNPDFIKAFTSFATGNRKTAFTICEDVIRLYCQHIRDAANAKEEIVLAKDRKGLCKYCTKVDCTAIRTPIEMTRWHCLFSFIQYKMIEENELEARKKTVKDIILCLKKAIEMIKENKLQHLPEFQYLWRESNLKCCILYCDYLELPWSARVFIDKLKNTEDVDDEQTKIIIKYEEIVEKKCIMWYLLRR